MNLSIATLDSLIESKSINEPTNSASSTQTENLTRGKLPELSDDPLPNNEAGQQTSPYLPRLLKSVINLVKTSNTLPTGEEFSLRSTRFPCLLNSAHQSLNSTFNKLLNYLEVPISSQDSNNSLDYYYQEFEAFKDLLELASNKMDYGLEIHNNHPDEDIRGLASLQNTSSEVTKDEKVEKNFGAHSMISTILNLPSLNKPSLEEIHNATKGRPQYNWIHLIDNFRTYFIPRLKYKPHSLTPLNLDEDLNSNDKTINEEVNPQESFTINTQANMNTGNKRPPHSPNFHPFKDEIQAMKWHIQSSADIDTSMSKNDLFTANIALSQPILPLQLEDTPLILVKTQAELKEMIQEINNGDNPVIGIDLEHHSYRTYRGFVCLIQISSRRKDWIIDPFEIFEELTELNQITANPAVLKIFHGSAHDILWLQKDFSVYVVNLFDTYQAARVLETPNGFSLSNLLSIYCQVKAEKQYQLSDWRVRPLKQNLIHYARSDSHYLPYIYDVMKNQLLTKVRMDGFKLDLPDDLESLQVTHLGRTLFQRVCQSSREMCLKRYTDMTFTPAEKAYSLYKSFGKSLSPDSHFAMLNLITWRDHLARSLDESWQYIMKDEFILRIAINKPTSYQELSNLFHPMGPIMKKYSREILQQVVTGVAHPDFLNSPDIPPKASQSSINSFNLAPVSNFNDQPCNNKETIQSHSDLTLENKNHNPYTTSTQAEVKASYNNEDIPEGISLTHELLHQDSFKSEVKTPESDVESNESVDESNSMDLLVSPITHDSTMNGLEEHLFTRSYDQFLNNNDPKSKILASEVYNLLKVNFSKNSWFLPTTQDKDYYIEKAPNENEIKQDLQINDIVSSIAEFSKQAQKAENYTTHINEESQIKLNPQSDPLGSEKIMKDTILGKYKQSNTLERIKKKGRKLPDGQHDHPKAQKYDHDTTNDSVIKDSSKLNKRVFKTNFRSSEAQWMPAAFIDPSKHDYYTQDSFVKNNKMKTIKKPKSLGSRRN